MSDLCETDRGKDQAATRGSHPRALSWTRIPRSIPREIWNGFTLSNRFEIIRVRNYLNKWLDYIGRF